MLESIESIQLPPMPQVLTRFLTLVEDDLAPFAELSALASLDPALTAQFLTVANSPPFRKGAPARTLEQCLAAIGSPMLRVLATTMAVRNVYARNIYERNYDFSGFWGHSLLVAELASFLAASVNYPDIEEAYLAGLLHDIGQLLLLGGAGEGYGFLLGICSNEGELHGFEKSYLGTNHAILGAQLVDQWGLISFMADAVLFHQNPADEITSADLLSRIVWSAHVLSACNGKQDGGQIPAADISTLSSLIGVDSATMSAACRHSLGRVAESAAKLGVSFTQTEKTLPCSIFISRDVSLPKSDEKESAQAHLETMLRNMAVMQPLQQSLYTLSGEGDLYFALRESAKIMFGLRRLEFMVFQPEKQSLSGVVIEGEPSLLTRLEIPLSGVQSLVAAALNEERPRCSFAVDDEPVSSLVDVQIARVLRCEGLLCIPMRTRGQIFGVMVFGLSGEQFVRKRKHLDWMVSFANVAAVGLETFRTLRKRDRDIEAHALRQFEQRARKVIHEVANPLCIMNGYLAIVSERLCDEHGVQQELDILKEELYRVERIVRSLNGQDEQPPAIDTVDINKVIAGMLALYKESLFDSRKITVEQHLAPDLALARGDRDSIKQILLNLWQNSSEAMADGGLLRITTQAQLLEGDCGCIEIQLSDTGPGIPDDVMERLFQPLEPDRRAAHSGVGLSIVASLVEQLGGKIVCQSYPGKGTSFSIRLQQG